MIAEAFYYTDRDGRPSVRLVDVNGRVWRNSDRSWYSLCQWVAGMLAAGKPETARKDEER